MSIEVEVKVLDVDLEDVARRLESLGAVRAATVRQETAVFDHPDGRLLDAGAYVRVRRGGDRTRLAYKGAAEASSADYKIKTEIEFDVPDFDQACALLEAIGLARLSFYEKDRTTYRLGDIEFCLDRWPHMPGYLEIEAPTPAGVDEGLRALEIDPARANTMGPREVFAHYGHDIDSMKNVTFDA